MLFEHMGAEGLAEVQVLSPSRWHDERCKTVHQQGYQHECLDVVGQSILSYKLRGLEDSIKEFNPNILYVMEEPYTPFARYCSKISRRQNIPMAIFTWENILAKSFGVHFDSLEEEVINTASVLVAGSESAKRRLMHKGAAEDKIAICPQTGINTDIFKPMPEVNKGYDVAYIGRLVKEKGIESIETVVKNLNVKMLWVGGRGDMTPSYGNYVGWVDYLRLPELINRAKVGVQFPYAFNNYCEQANYANLECLSCGIPIISSTNGSISEFLGDCKGAFLIPEEDTELLEEKIIYLQEGIDSRGKMGDYGRKYVIKQYGYKTIEKKLVDIFKRFV